MQADEMRVAVIGPGAVGGTFGGLLARAGVPVSLVARGEHLRAIRERGLRVEGPTGAFVVKTPATDRPGEIGPVDLVLVSVKSYDTPEAARIAPPLLHDSTTVLSLQNGVDNEAVLSDALGAGRVLGGIAYVGASVEAPGVIRHDLRGRIRMGELDGVVTARAKRIRDLFESAGIPCHLSTDIRGDLWAKLVGNSVINVVPAVTGCRVGDLVGEPGVEAFVRDALEEAAGVGRACGHATPEGSIERHLEFCRKYPDFETSTQQDVRRGRPLESEALNGAIVRRGAERGVPTPIHATLHALLRARASIGPGHGSSGDAGS